ncbi:MAG TPA: type VI secretion system tube protein Hcp [Chitinophagaceae bacterium]|nr:type VI secretion system tube protein Hcp [Chitinophagaceae bacterium]
MKNLKFFLLLLPFLLYTGITSAQRMYIKIDGVDGESTERGHEKWIDLLSYKQGVNAESGAVSGAARMRTGKTTFSDLTIVKKIDKTSPLLMEKCAKGLTIPKVELEITAPNRNGTSGVFYKITLTDVRISGVNASSDCSSGCQTMEEVSFYYNKISWEYTGSNGNTQATYDIRTNQ